MSSGEDELAPQLGRMPEDSILEEYSFLGISSYVSLLVMVCPTLGEVFSKEWNR